MESTSLQWSQLEQMHVLYTDGPICIIAHILNQRRNAGMQARAKYIRVSMLQLAIGDEA